VRSAHRRRPSSFRGARQGEPGTQGQTLRHRPLDSGSRSRASGMTKARLSNVPHPRRPHTSSAPRKSIRHRRPAHTLHPSPFHRSSWIPVQPTKRRCALSVSQCCSAADVAKHPAARGALARVKRGGGAPRTTPDDRPCRSGSSSGARNAASAKPAANGEGASGIAAEHGDPHAAGVTASGSETPPATEPALTKRNGARATRTASQYAAHKEPPSALPTRPGSGCFANPHRRARPRAWMADCSGAGRCAQMNCTTIGQQKAMGEMSGVAIGR